MELAAQMGTSSILGDSSFSDQAFGNLTFLRPERDVEEHFNGWNAHPSTAPFIADHWKSFPAPHPFLHYVHGFINLIFFFVSTIGNGTVIWVFLTERALRTPGNMFIVSLSLMDFCMMVKAPMVVYMSFKCGPVMDIFWFRIYAFFGMISCGGGTWNNALIAFDRYRTIAKPFDGKLTSTQVLLMQLALYTFVVPMALMPALSLWCDFVPEAYLTTSTASAFMGDVLCDGYIYCCFSFFFVLPALIIAYYYSQIYGHVKAHEKAMREQAKKMNVKSLRSVGSKEEQEKSAECRVAKVGMTTFMLHIVSWLPYVVLMFHGATRNYEPITPFLAIFPAFFCKAVACFDPFAYAFNHPKYRQALMKKLPWMCIKEEAPKENASAATPSEAPAEEKA